MTDRQHRQHPFALTMLTIVFLYADHSRRIADLGASCSEWREEPKVIALLR